jgi:polysaccharide biosynthesis transport protein
VSVQEPVQQADARIITMAAVPSEPSFPKLRVLIPGGLAFGVLLGAVIALMRELFRSGFKGSQDIELECELPSLGSVPMVPAVWFKTLPPQDALLDRPRSGFTEAVAAVRTAMQASLSGGDAAKTFLITSSLPGEGKTTLAISLGRSFAESGRRTLLLDCDNRQASIVAALSNPAERAGDSRQPGITSILRDRVPWREAIRKDHRSRLYYIPAGPSANAPQDLFTSSAARQFLEAARQEFDVILIDSPPITAVPDALILSRLVDATMLVVRWGATPREIAKTSLNKLLMNGARLCGVVLMAVDMRRGVFSFFSLADPEYYHRHNQKYYAS